MTKTKIVNLEKLYNFVVQNFFIRIRLGPQKLIIKTILPSAKFMAHGKIGVCRVPK